MDLFGTYKNQNECRMTYICNRTLAGSTFMNPLLCICKNCLNNMKLFRTKRKIRHPNLSPPPIITPQKTMEVVELQNNDVLKTTFKENYTIKQAKTKIFPTYHMVPNYRTVIKNQSYKSRIKGHYATELKLLVYHLDIVLRGERKDRYLPTLRNSSVSYSGRIEKRQAISLPDILILLLFNQACAICVNVASSSLSFNFLNSLEAKSTRFILKYIIKDNKFKKCYLIFTNTYPSRESSFLRTLRADS
ncbi:hypothetical protein AGLY_009679 [Aphis glycines]|uniref:Uncharacterized protein n=1 Tax=Aphis glycines TaxID=307491 RepID=A0A6G0TIR9_APHGL|nr:hypothetical protein AGLY_009679 [Aphis glycines]